MCSLRKNGIYKTLSPSEIVLGTPKIDATHDTLQPGSYVHCKQSQELQTT